MWLFFPYAAAMVVSVVSFKAAIAIEVARGSEIITRAHLATNLVSVVVGIVFVSVLLYRMWAQLECETQMSPGRAVGRCFVPVFNLYWIFVAVYGLTGTLKRTMASRSVPGPAPSPGLALAACVTNVLLLIPIAGFVLSGVSSVLWFLTFWMLASSSKRLAAGAHSDFAVTNKVPVRRMRIIIIGALWFSFPAMPLLVVPKFEAVFNDFGVNLPWISVAVINFSRWFSGANPGQVIPGALIIDVPYILAFVVPVIMLVYGPNRRIGRLLLRTLVVFTLALLVTMALSMAFPWIAMKEALSGGPF
jgi:hypothetical protein